MLFRSIIGASILSQKYLHGGNEVANDLNFLEQMLGVLTGGTKFPWQTQTGEGFIAPWTEKTPMAGGWAPEATLPGALEAQVVKTWNTGTATFYLMANGLIGTRKKNGQWKTWRPAKHIVVPRNPRIGTLIRADKRIDRLMRGLARRTSKLSTSRRPRASLTTADISQVVKLLKAGG